MVSKPIPQEIPLKSKLIAHAAVALIRLFGFTLRSRLIDRGNFKGKLEFDKESSFIWGLWHNGLFSLPIIYKRYLYTRHGAAMASASKDGAIVAKVLQILGIGAIRGSSSRRGGQALLEMASWLENGYDVAMTPDGPRGPKHHCSPGIVHLASKTGCKIFPLRVHYHNCWTLKSWDQFRIPKPFSRLDIYLGPGIDVPKDLDAAGLEVHRQRVEALLTGDVPEDDGPEGVFPANLEATS